MFVLKAAEMLSWEMVQVLGERGKECQAALVYHRHLCDAVALALILWEMRCEMSSSVMCSEVN